MAQRTSFGRGAVHRTATMSSSHESDKPPPTLYSISIGLLAGGVAGGVYVPLARPVAVRSWIHETNITAARVQIPDSCGANRAPQDSHASSGER